MADLLVDQLRAMARAHPDAVGYRLLDSGEAITFAEWDQPSSRLARGLADLRLAVTTDDVASTTPWAEVLCDDAADFQVEVGPSDLADIMYTSGTTGSPKGVAVTHDVLGEDVVAVVVAREGHDLDTAELIAFCRERLADYKTPRRVEVRAELPRNATGKVLKRVLVDELEAAP